MLGSRVRCLASVDARGTLEEKSRVHEHCSQRQATVPQKEKPRGSASSESVRAGLLPRADLFEIIGALFDTVNDWHGSPRRAGSVSSVPGSQLNI
jgi:hypothetical protein